MDLLDFIREQNRNKIVLLSDFPFFCFHCVSFLALAYTLNVFHPFSTSFLPILSERRIIE